MKEMQQIIIVINGRSSELRIITSLIEVFILRTMDYIMSKFIQEHF